MTRTHLKWKQQSNAIFCKEAVSACSVLGSTDKLLPVHEVLQITLPLWLRHRDAGENSDIKQYLFLYSFIAENSASVQPLLKANIIHQTGQDFNPFHAIFFTED